MNAKIKLSIILFFAALNINAVEITQRQAAAAAGNWMRRNPRPLEAHIGQTVLATKTYRDESDTPLFHVVRFKEGGFVVMPADDGIQPIIAFSSGDDLIADPRNPFWVLLNRDISQRLAGTRLPVPQPQLLNTTLGGAAHEKEWLNLLSDDSSISPLGLSTISDVRVSPLVQSKWNQLTVSGYTTYNYYTPYNDPCGCVATAGSQVMRYHQWPAGSVTAGSYSCFIDGVLTVLTMQGGTYSWSNMPLVPTYSITEVQRQAIGKLTSDLGISCYMQYTATGSGAYSPNLTKAFTDRFGYASAKIILDQTNGTDGYLQDAVLSNLEAGFPVVFGIQDTVANAGHEVVGDGYGYSGSTLYTHLNMGWGGSYDAWYNLPTIDAAGYNFNVVGSIIYNIFPENTGEIISGRVLDVSGLPVSGATVVAYNETLGTTLDPVTSNDKGIYSFLVPEPASTHTYTITATSGSLIGDETTTVSASVSTSTTYFQTTGGLTYSPGSGSVGNSWGVDLTLDVPPALESIVITGPSSVDEDSSASYTCTAYYSDSSSRNVTASTTWSENSAYASISSAGLLTAASVSSVQAVTISASYSEGGVTKEDTLAVTIANILMSESFETDMGVWTASAGNDGDWQRNSGYTDSNNTGPSGASDGDWYVYVEVNTIGTPAKTAAMEAHFDLSGVSSLELNFDYHMFGRDMGSLYIDVYDGVTWYNGIWSRSGQQQTSYTAPWLEATVDLSAYTGSSDAVIRIRGVTGSNIKGDMAVDNIRLFDKSPASAGVSYTDWVTSEGIPEGQDGESDTPAGDDIPNLLKYACGLDAMTAYSTTDLLPVVEVETDVFSIHYYKSKSATDVTLEAIWAGTLSGAWSASGITDVLVYDGEEREERKASISLDNGGFMRLRATSTP